MTDSSQPGFSLSSILAQIRRILRLGKPPIVIPQPVDHSDARLAAQISVIRRAFEKKGEDVAIAGPDGLSRSTEGSTFLYRPGHVLVRDGEDFEILDRFFREPEREGDFRGVLERTEIPTMPGLVVASVPSRTDGADDVLTTLDEVDRANPERAERRDPVATPDHVLYVAGGARLCPATEPEEPPSTTPVPPVASNKKAGSNVRISVVDTGWWEKAGKNISWLSGVTPADPADVEQVDPNKIHEYAGHGTFVAGVVRCMAPSAQVEVEGFAPTKDDGGAVWESQICKQLNEAILDDDDAHIISVSAGTHTRNSFPLISFELLALAKGILDPKNKVLVVAAAGNDSSTDEFYPAAFDWVVGVGSVDSNGKISDFSNTSDPKGKDWVNVYARGRDLINAFPVGKYICYEPENIHSGVPDERHFRGMAKWSGTSFSTPIVSGAIAAQMSAMPTTDPRAAYDALINGAQPGTNAKIGSYRIIGPL